MIRRLTLFSVASITFILLFLGFQQLHSVHEGETWHSHNDGDSWHKHTEGHHSHAHNHHSHADGKHSHAHGKHSHAHDGNPKTNSDHEILWHSHKNQHLIKERMLENRRNRTTLKSELENFKSRNSSDGTFWVPVVFHMASRSDGTGQHKDDWVLEQICYLNQNFGVPNIKFYLKSINRFNSIQLYEDNNNADFVRSIHRVAEAVNIYVGGPAVAGTDYGAFYSPGFDWIFTWNDIYNWGISHEMGHLFSLPHTFYGWEDTDYVTASAGSGKAPEIGSNGLPVEKVARGVAGENCQYAADGFCDTPPDYSSSGGGCSSTATWFDPDSVQFSLDQINIVNYMSYFFCTPKVFTAEQKEAIELDATSRGFHFNAAPSPLETTDGDAPSLVWPSNNSLAPYTNNAVHFQWDAVSSAGMYLVTVNRTFNGTVIEDIYQKIVYSNEAWLVLEPNQEFNWSVQALTRYDACPNGQNTSSSNTFRTSDWTVDNSTIQSPIEYSSVFPNPTKANKEVFIEISVGLPTEAQISVSNSLGQNVLSTQTSNLQVGKNIEQINIETLSAGMYIISIETATERISHKLVVQE